VLSVHATVGTLRVTSIADTIALSFWFWNHRFSRPSVTVTCFVLITAVWVAPVTAAMSKSFRISLRSANTSNVRCPACEYVGSMNKNLTRYVPLRIGIEYEKFPYRRVSNRPSSVVPAISASPPATVPAVKRSSARQVLPEAST
jgi:hypothetical protein